MHRSILFFKKSTFALSVFALVFIGGMNWAPARANTEGENVLRTAPLELQTAFLDTIRAEQPVDPFLPASKMTASDASAGDSFGYSVAINGDTALIGAPEADLTSPTRNNAGAAYVFVRSGSDWIQQAKLISGEADSWFGSSVAIWGDTALIGAMQSTVSGQGNAGAAYVFTRSGGVWTQQAKLTSDTPQVGDYLGASVALSNDTAVVGAYGVDLTSPARENAGAAYIFVRSGTVWTRQAKLTASDAGIEDIFGWRVAISGDTVLIGAPRADLTSPARIDGGAAYIFNRNGTTWTQTAKLTGTDTAEQDQFGTSVALEADTALVGAYNGDQPSPPLVDTGVVYVFINTDGTWAQQTKLYDSRGKARSFGYSISLRNGTLLIGAPYTPDDNGGGTVFVFVRSGPAWLPISIILSSDTGNNFGYSVAVSGGFGLAGDPKADLNSPPRIDAGSVSLLISPLTNLLGNGDFIFDIGHPSGNWAAFSEPPNGIVANINDGVLEFYRQPGSEQALILQQTNTLLSAYTGLDVWLDMGNGGATRKRFTVLVHDTLFGDLQICSFWLAPNAPMQTYRMYARSTRDWSNTVISIYAATADGTPSYRLDNVWMSYNRTHPAPAETICVDPNAPAPTAGADSANLITNGNFSANNLTGSNNNWGTYFNIFAQISGGQLEMYNLPRTPPAGSGVVLQNTTNPIAVNTPFQIDFTLASTIPSPTWTRVAVIAHRRDFTDLQVCLFWLPPNTAAANYTMRSYTTQAWDSANPFSLSLYPNPSFASAPGGVIRVDNVVVRTRPTLDVSGTECYEPGMLPASMDVSQLDTIEPILLPTATSIPYVAPNAPLEIPVIGTPFAPAEPVSIGEGTFSE